jgi:hypothetical protein
VFGNVHTENIFTDEEASLYRALQAWNGLTLWTSSNFAGDLARSAKDPIYESGIEGPGDTIVSIYI